MKHIHLFKTVGVAVLAGGPPASVALAQSQGGHGMGSGMMGGYGGGWMGGDCGGVWLLVLLVAVVAGLIGWLIAKKRK